MAAPADRSAVRTAGARRASGGRGQRSRDAGCAERRGDGRRTADGALDRTALHRTPLRPAAPDRIGRSRIGCCRTPVLRRARHGTTVDHLQSCTSPTRHPETSPWPSRHRPRPPAPYNRRRSPHTELPPPSRYAHNVPHMEWNTEVDRWVTPSRARGRTRARRRSDLPSTSVRGGGGRGQENTRSPGGATNRWTLPGSGPNWARPTVTCGRYENTSENTGHGPSVSSDLDPVSCRISSVFRPRCR